MVVIEACYVIIVLYYIIHFIMLCSLSLHYIVLHYLTCTPRSRLPLIYCILLCPCYNVLCFAIPHYVTVHYTTRINIACLGHAQPRGIYN